VRKTVYGRCPKIALATMRAFRCNSAIGESRDWPWLGIPLKSMRGPPEDEDGATAVTIEIPTTGERFAGRLIEEPFGALCLTGRSNRPCYVLSRVLEIGWRIVESTSDERELMGTHGITPDALGAAATAVRFVGSTEPTAAEEVRSQSR
jgi:hypothetical protein